MRIVTVQARIRDHAVEPFLAASIANGRAAVGAEPGCRRFDIFRDVEDPNRIGFNEVYDDDAAVLAHGETKHFLAWLTATDGMADGEMVWATCHNLFPGDDAGWDSAGGDADSVGGGLHVSQARLSVPEEEAERVAAASAAQAAAAVGEQGCLRFDVSQNQDDPAELWIYTVRVDRFPLELGDLASSDRVLSITGTNVWPPDDWAWKSGSYFD